MNDFIQLSMRFSFGTNLQMSLKSLKTGLNLQYIMCSTSVNNCYSSALNLLTADGQPGCAEINCNLRIEVICC